MAMALTMAMARQTTTVGDFPNDDFYGTSRIEARAIRLHVEDRPRFRRHPRQRLRPQPLPLICLLRLVTAAKVAVHGAAGSIRVVDEPTVPCMGVEDDDGSGWGNDL